ncbi:MAG: type II toxin-antitoxin system VapC family toxin [Candidatus Eremiobacteraeota bacterium]|nr:type II toxin-antitoxin system VapC family toxin [Candidatus Eremiobacteraeota bacterium]
MRILLDSHVFVWVKAGPENLSDQARAAIIDPANEVFVSVASAWELWIKHSKKSIVQLAPVLDSGARGFLKGLTESDIELLDVTLEHAAMAAALPHLHRDPFDRMLIAQALLERLTLMTSDRQFKRYKGLRIIGV